jgi:hypothetical protein
LNEVALAVAKPKNSKFFTKSQIESQKHLHQTTFRTTASQLKKKRLIGINVKNH